MHTVTLQYGPKAWHAVALNIENMTSSIHGTMENIQYQVQLLPTEYDGGVTFKKCSLLRLSTRSIAHVIFLSLSYRILLHCIWCITGYSKPGWTCRRNKICEREDIPTFSLTADPIEMCKFEHNLGHCWDLYETVEKIQRDDPKCKIQTF